MSEKIQTLFSKIAPRYDRINTVLSLTNDRRWRRQAVALLKTDPYQRVLDLCAGTLEMSRALLQVNPRVKIDAVDFSEPMLKVGLNKIPFGQRERVRLHCKDVTTLDFPNNTFDGVMCAYGLRNISDNETVLKNLKRMLKSRGKLVILDFYAPEKIFPKLFQMSYARFMIPTIGRLVSGNKAAYNHLKDSMRAYYTPTAYRLLLSELGFCNIGIKPQMGGISYLISGEIP